MNITAKTKSGNFGVQFTGVIPEAKLADVLAAGIVGYAESIFPSFHKGKKNVKEIPFSVAEAARMQELLQKGLEKEGITGLSISIAQREWSDAAVAASKAREQLQAGALELFTLLQTVGKTPEEAEAAAKKVYAEFSAPKAAEEPAPVQQDAPTGEIVEG